MKAQDRQQIERVLSRIPRDEWERFLENEGHELRYRIKAVRNALRAAGLISRGAPPRPIAEIISLFGYRLLSIPTPGLWLRQKILESLPHRTWKRLVDKYNEIPSRRAKPLNGRISQHGKGSRVMAGRWHQGSKWARAFCEAVGLPAVLAQQAKNPLPDDEEILPVEPLPPLHDFQVDIYRALRHLMRNGQGKTAMMSLPTGAGKTRVTVEAICDHLAEDANARNGRNLVLWIAQSNELQRQAWECFRQVWQVPPLRRDERSIRRALPMRILRLWGGRTPDDIEFGDETTVLVAGIDQLTSWVRKHQNFFETFPDQRLACVVLDEAHSLITHEYRTVMLALRLRAMRQWLPHPEAPPVIGLSATPWRTLDEESTLLRKYFQSHLVRPESLGHKPIAVLQERGFLARVRAERLKIHGTRPMTEAQQRMFETFKELPSDYLEQLGFEQRRNARILERLVRLPECSRVLVFACSVAHAEILTIALNRALGTECAAVVTGETPRAQRADIIERFRVGELRFLCNVGVLTTGFDAPKVDVVCLTRPTTSAIRYEQMVGRGLRGPKNGGTHECLVLDVQDEGLPDGIQSYARVAHLWDG